RHGGRDRHPLHGAADVAAQSPQGPQGARSHQGLTSSMPRVVLVGNLAQLTGGVAEFELSATSVKQLYQQLTELHPAIGPHLETGVAVAIDGQIFQDALLEPIGQDSEVFLLPQIAGGRSNRLRSVPPEGPRASGLAPLEQLDPDVVGCFDEGDPDAWTDGAWLQREAGAPTLEL